MTTLALFKEYIWLVNTIHQAGSISLNEINEKWVRTEMSEGVEMARSTFNRHRIAIEEIFGIIIDCNRRNDYKYFIGNEDVLHDNSVQNWMLTTLSVGNVVSESLSLQNRILLENIPSGGDFLQLVIKAMRENHLVNLEYRRYGAAESTKYSLAPYCVKLYRQRWYLLGQKNNGEFRIFSLDRIVDLSVGDDNFVIDKDFDANEFFSECFGIVIADPTETQRIVIRAYGDEPYYMKTLPIHHSQKLIIETDDYADFELYMRPTLDFSGYMLSRACKARIIEPQWLADEIHDMHLAAVQMYEEDEETSC